MAQQGHGTVYRQNLVTTRDKVTGDPALAGADFERGAPGRWNDPVEECVAIAPVGVMSRRASPLHPVLSFDLPRPAVVHGVTVAEPGSRRRLIARPRMAVERRP